MVLDPVDKKEKVPSNSMTSSIRTRSQCMIDIENVRREIKRLERIEADLRAKLDAKLDKIKY